MGYAGYVPAKLAPEKPTDLQAALWQASSPTLKCSLTIMCRSLGSSQHLPMQISQTEALDTLEKLVQNVAKAPTEPKYRKIRLSNPKITTAVIQTPGSLAALQLMGWEASVEDDSLVLPSNRQITFAQVRAQLNVMGRSTRPSSDWLHAHVWLPACSWAIEQNLKVQVSLCCICTAGCCGNVQVALPVIHEKSGQPSQWRALTLYMVQARMIDDARQRLVKLQKEAARKKTVAKAPVTKEQLALRAQMEADRRERAGMAPSQGSRAQSLPGGNMAGQAMQLKNLGAAAPDEEE